MNTAGPTFARMKANSPYPRIGVLGGGQLGKMLYEAACPWGLPLYMLDQQLDYPAGLVNPYFTAGDFTDYEDVMAFSADKDILTIEIERVNQQALEELADQGKKVYPQPEALAIIRDKYQQKRFYRQHGIPTADFRYVADWQSIQALVTEQTIALPFVQKACTGGYDGRGVQVVRDINDLNQLLQLPSIIEPLVNIERELAVIAARSPSGDLATFPLVEMVFHPTANLVEWLACPARVSDTVAHQADALAREVIQTYNLVGLLAVEFFWTTDGQLLVNEVAPRPHNSGHHTQDSCTVSQFEQHLRSILDWPLAQPKLLQPAVMLNLLGEPDYTGPANYRGIENAMSIPGVHLHLYGKTTSKPYRKMGHANITASTLEEAETIAQKVRDQFMIGKKDG